MKLNKPVCNVYFISVLFCSLIYWLLFYLNSHLISPILFIISFIFFCPFLLFIYALKEPTKQEKVFPFIFLSIISVKLLKILSMGTSEGQADKILEIIDTLYDPFAITFLFFLPDFYKSKKY